MSCRRDTYMGYTYPPMYPLCRTEIQIKIQFLIHLRSNCQIYSIYFRYNQQITFSPRMQSKKKKDKIKGKLGYCHNICNFICLYTHLVVYSIPINIMILAEVEMKCERRDRKAVV